MIRTILPADMKRVETAVMQHTSITGDLLMQRAASHVAQAVRRLYAGKPGWVLCVCGAGNNGGDGLVAMRMLAEADDGFSGECWMLSRRLSADSMRELDRLEKQAGHRVLIRWLEEDIPQISVKPLVIIDAMFGTGLARPLDGMALRMCRWINDQQVPVVAVDIPSGLSGETGDVLGGAVMASHTVTFHRPKPGLYLKNGPDYAGEIIVGDIGLHAPEAAVYDDAEGFSVLEEKDLPRFLPKRRRATHKGSYGRVLLFAGSRGMAGAAAISAMAALRSGAGLVTVACADRIVDVVQTLCPCATCLPLPEDAGEAWNVLETKLEWADALGAGCGLGLGEWQQAMLARLTEWLSQHELPAVLDADALTLLSRQETKPAKATLLLTPHPAEAARLLHQNTADVVKDAAAAAQTLSQNYHASVVLKGAVSVLCSGKAMALNPFGTPAMAKGGSGDALTGILAALLAGRAAGAYAMSDLELMQCGCAMHGLAGEMAAHQYGDRGMLATDLCACLGLCGMAKAEPCAEQKTETSVVPSQKVTITVEHAAGMREDGRNGTRYLRNCGYVQEVLESRNAWQDACICCVEEPLEWFEGTVAAHVQLEDGVVWAVVPDGVHLSETRIRAEMAFLGAIHSVELL
ncbi:MAG: NAD(P)H-hydrate dehydratase [bacterium]|nr:NAD(P)H-hydrate dehydratase [bacterium]